VREIEAPDIGANPIVGDARAEAQAPILGVERDEVRLEGGALVAAQADGGDGVIVHGAPLESLVHA
jgi:hypothetical protein